jgi:phosphate transport system permease protein
MRPKHRSDSVMKYLFAGSALSVTLIILIVIVFLGRQGLETFRDVSPWQFFFSTRWEPAKGAYGAAVFMIGTFLVTLIALVLSTPLGIACAIFMAKVAPRRIREIMRPATDLFVGIPSVVYGFIGLVVVVPFLRKHVGQPGFGVLAGGILLAVMVLPTIISVTEDTLRGLPEALEEASYALGATRWQTIRNVLLPAASPGILTAVILAMGRAIGETMAVQMVIGNTPLLPRSLASPTSVLTSEIVMEMGNTQFGTTWNNALFLMALLLLVISLALIILIRLVTARRERV